MPTGSGGGLATVNTNGTLTGTGTPASPLSTSLSKFYPLTHDYLSASTGLGLVINQTYAIGLWFPSCSASALSFNVTAIDGAGLYDMGLYNAAGTLVVNIGAQHLGTAGFVTINFVQGLTTIPAGLYFWAWTGNAITATIGYLSSGCAVYATNTSAGATSAGALAASISPLARSVVFNANMPQFAISS